MECSRAPEAAGLVLVTGAETRAWVAAVVVPAAAEVELGEITVVTGTVDGGWE